MCVPDAKQAPCARAGHLLAVFQGYHAAPALPHHQAHKLPPRLLRDLRMQAHAAVRRRMTCGLQKRIGPGVYTCLLDARDKAPVPHQDTPIRCLQKPLLFGFDGSLPGAGARKGSFQKKTSSRSGSSVPAPPLSDRRTSPWRVAERFARLASYDFVRPKRGQGLPGEKGRCGPGGLVPRPSKRRRRRKITQRRKQIRAGKRIARWGPRQGVLGRPTR